MLVSGTFTMAMAYIMSLCDSVIAGRMIGADGVVAVNMAAPLFGVTIFLASCISEGISIIYTRAIGGMRRKKADQIFGMGLMVTVIIACLITILLISVRQVYFENAGAGGTVLGYAMEYYRFLPLYGPLMIICQYMEQMVYSDGDEKLVMLSYMVQIAGNVVVSVILAKFMGICGIMLGTVAGSAAAFLILSAHFLKKSNTLRFIFYFSWKVLIRCFKYSITDAVVFLLWGVVNYALISIISRNYGEQYLVVLAVVISLIEFTTVFDGIGMAIQPLTGVYFGEKNHLMIMRLMKDAIFTAVLEGVLATTLIFVLAPQFAWIFGIDDPAMIDAAVAAIRIVSLTFTASSLFMLETSYYLYIDHIGFSVGAICLKDCVLYIVLPLLFSAAAGVNGLWTGIAAAPVLGIVLSMLALRLYAGKELFPSLLDTRESEIIVYDAMLTPDSMVKASMDVEEQMKKHNYPDNTCVKAALFTEEISATVREKNGDARVHMEYTLIFEKDSVRLVIRDSGIIFDVTDPDMKVAGISSFFLNGLLTAQKEKGYIPTTGYNRNLIRFDYSFEKNVSGKSVNSQSDSLHSQQTVR